MSSLKSVRCQFPGSSKELLEIVTQTSENGLSLKHTFGRFPVSSEPADVVVSLAALTRLLTYDPLRQTVTVEPGIGLAELLARLEHFDLTLDLAGWVVDMAVGDAVATGLPAFAGCLERCTVLLPGGTTTQLGWPPHDDDPLVPSLKSLVCGLGTTGIVTTATLHCVPNRRALESVSFTAVASLEAPPADLGGATLALRAHWFPLSDRCVVTRSSLVRLRSAVGMPASRRALEGALGALACALRFLSAPIAWHLPCLAFALSSAQLAVCAAVAGLRDGHAHPCARPRSARKHCAGIEWVCPADTAPRMLAAVGDWVKPFQLSKPNLLSYPSFAVGDWARQNPRHVSSPVLLAWQPAGKPGRRPLLDPAPSGQPALSVWLDWFGHASLSHGCCLPMAGLESALQECGAVKSWCAGPVHGSALIAAGYHGYRRWQRIRRAVDPRGRQRSGFVTGDLAGTSEPSRHRGDK